MDTRSQKVIFSSKSDEWGTPDNIYNKLNRKYKFTLDPCATNQNHKCPKYYTMMDDGLSKAWKDEVVFVNPPYGNIGTWVKKAAEESINNGALVVLLIPARTDTKYWHDYIMKYASAIHFIKGRLKFKNLNSDAPSHSAPFPSVVVEFGGFQWSPTPKILTMER